MKCDICFAWSIIHAATVCLGVKRGRNRKEESIDILDKLIHHKKYTLYNIRKKELIMFNLMSSFSSVSDLNIANCQYF